MSDRHPIPQVMAELAGTALLVLVGLSVVIFDFGTGSPLARVLPDPGARRLVTGFLFGCTGALIAVSPLGKSSGAHINPAVTLAFWMKGRIRGRHAVAYVVAQLVGCVVGAVPLLLWGGMGRSIGFGATAPGPQYGTSTALLGEVVTTFTMLTLVFVFLARDRIRRFTPLIFPPLYAIMVFLEAPISGTSTNPARSLGPSVVAEIWQAWWVYWVGPLAGAVLATLAHTWLGRFEVEVAKLYHFDHDPHGIFAWREIPRLLRWGRRAGSA